MLQIKIVLKCKKNEIREIWGILRLKSQSLDTTQAIFYMSFTFCLFLFSCLMSIHRRWIPYSFVVLGHSSIQSLYRIQLSWGSNTHLSNHNTEMKKKKKVGLIVIHLSFYFSLDKTCMLEIFFHLPKALKWIKFVSKANFYQQSITEDTQGDRHFTVSPKLTPKKSYTTFSLYFFFF